jgi:hypothetical protein
MHHIASTSMSGATTGPSCSAGCVRYYGVPREHSCVCRQHAHRRLCRRWLTVAYFLLTYFYRDERVASLLLACASETT